jgi:peptide deformylase
MAKLKGKSKAKARKKRRLKSAKISESYRQSFLDKIIKWDNPILYTKCQNVFPGENIEEIKKLMSRILIFSKNGVGLAAPQIGVSKRIVAVKHKSSISFFINAEIMESSEETLVGEEGCLSFPGIIAVITRNKKIKVKYDCEEGHEHISEFEDFMSIVLQHEIDHTNGICKVGDEWKKQKGFLPIENEEPLEGSLEEA